MALIIREPKHLEILEDLGTGPLASTDNLLLLVSSSGGLAREAVLASIRESGVINESENLDRIENAWPLGDLRLKDGGRRVAVVLSSEKFSDSQMGFSEKVNPSETQRSRYDEQFDLLDWLFDRAKDEATEVAEETESQPEGER